MKEYYTLIQLVEDESFQLYVKQPDSPAGVRWQHWLQNHPEQADNVDRAKQIVMGLKFKKEEPDQQMIEHAWLTFNDRISQSSPSRSVFPTYRVAAIITLCLLAGWASWYLMQPKLLSYQTGFGETKDLVLEDGTYVKLNANSELTYYSSKILSSERVVQLNGEAYFHVNSYQHEGVSSRFLVKTTHGKIEVLGTSFNVQSRHEQTQVVLESGKIKFEAEGTPTTLMEPGELLEYNNNVEQLTLKKVNPRKYTAWREQKLYFDETSLQDLSRILEDNYGLEVIITDPQMHDKKLSGEISANDLDKVLTAVSKLFSIRIRQTTDTVFFEPYAH